VIFSSFSLDHPRHFHSSSIFWKILVSIISISFHDDFDSPTVDVLSDRWISFHFIPFHFISFHFISFHSIWLDLIWSDLISSDFWWFSWTGSDLIWSDLIWFDLILMSDLILWWNSICDEWMICWCLKVITILSDFELKFECMELNEMIVENWMMNWENWPVCELKFDSNGFWWFIFIEHVQSLITTMSEFDDEGFGMCV
jgi:hypothetical protein